MFSFSFLVFGFPKTNYTKKVNMIPFYFQCVNTSPSEFSNAGLALLGAGGWAAAAASPSVLAPRSVDT
jgi:hypothetical protein